MDNSAAFGGIRDGAKDRLVMPKSCEFYQIVCLIFKFGACQVTFIYIALLTMQIVSKQLSNIKIGK